ISIRSNFEYIDRTIKKFYMKDGLVKVFKEEIEGNIYYQKTLEDMKASIKALEEKTDRASKIRLEKEKKLLERFELTDENIAAYLAGEMGDTNYYSIFLESYSSNPDPILGTFTNW